MTLKELETQLQSLTTTERADAIQILTPSLNQALRGITKTMEMQRIHKNFVQLAERIHESISSDDSLQNHLHRINQCGGTNDRLYRICPD